jgi:hypothetical protein
MLAAIEPPVLDRIGDRRGGAGVAGEVAIMITRQQPAQVVVKIVGPHRVEATAPFGQPADERDIVAIVLGNQQERPGDLCPECVGALFEKRPFALVVIRVRGVEAQSVEVIFLDPVHRVIQTEGANRGASLAPEVQGVAPRPPWREVLV